MEEPEAVPSILPSITRHGLSILLELLWLSHSVSKSPGLNDTVIIAIDFEGINTVKSGFTQKENSQVGFAILDTKELRQVPPEKLISTLNFATGSSSYVAKASNKFLFGETITIQPSSMVQTIQSHIPQDRNVVLVGHGILNELQALQALGFEFKRPPSGILDTSRIANEVFQIWAGSLGDLLGVLGCPFNRLHVAGNDANFTLRALLLVAAKWCISQHQDDEVLDILRDISTCPIPPYVDPEIKAAERREKRLVRSRKHQSKLWSKEKQNQIRAARETRRREHILALKSLEAGAMMVAQEEHGSHSIPSTATTPGPTSTGHHPLMRVAIHRDDPSFSRPSG
ncbi:Polynucleotidyl transferase [Lasiosphaeria ovina]|uniref:Polynucleotidyl transferase n=1 Tax=Lasiosphaeria ovina TaxID=92902 RepID=A0AAE0TTW5_9PEZI|nr:Polynucleotidyl transferase [Lasiosphaeria ovina]